MICLEPPASTAQENMQRDVLLLEEGRLTLHLYSWKNPSVTYGHFFDLEEHFNLDAAKKWGLDFGKRPTGGGALFHLYDLAFSITFPVEHPFYSENILQCYHNVNTFVADALKPLFNAEILPEQPESSVESASRFCMALPTKYDLLVDGKKVGGAAQRRTKKAVLHQGSISLVKPDKVLITEVLKEGEALYQQMLEQSCYLDGSIEDLRSQVKDCLLGATKLV